MVFPLHCPQSIKVEQYEQEYTLSDTMQRLMLTATDEQIQSYEPISYFDGLIIFDDSHKILYGNDAALHWRFIRL